MKSIFDDECESDQKNADARDRSSCDNDETLLTAEPDTLPHSRPLKYSAVSYTWGSSLEQRRIYVNDQALYLRQNLFDFLYQWSLKPECQAERLWIDQISINQSDKAERGHQVGQMAEIYKYALHVYIWLGLAFPGSEELVDALQSIRPRPNALHRLQEGEKAAAELLLPHKATIRRALLLPYWYRLWICQEVILAANPVVLIGQRRTYWDNFAIVVRSPSILNSHIDPDLVFASYRIFWLSVHNRTWHLNAGSLDWMSAIKLASESTYQEPLDGIYAFQGLLDTEVRIQADYSKTALEVFTEVAAKLRKSPDETTSIWIDSLAGVLHLKDAVPADEFKDLISSAKMGSGSNQSS